MLAAARDALVQHGVIASDDVLPPFFAKLGGNFVLGMLVYPKGDAFYVVKVAMQGELDREYRGLAAAHDALPRNTSRPLGLTHHRSFAVLVSTGIPHRPLSPIRGREGTQRFERGIDAYLAATARAFRMQPDDRAPTDLRDALEHASTLVKWPAWRAYLARIGPDIAALPRIAQHGDLSLNNIGTAHGELIFFDWEDFGLIDVTGFDLAVLLLSLNDFDLWRLIDQLHASTLEQRLMLNGCAQLALETERFLSFFPAYLALFARIKALGGYAPEVAGRALTALAQWLENDRTPAQRAAARPVSVAD